MTFNLFGYTILIAKRNKLGGLGHTVKGGCLITTNGIHLCLATPDGVIIPKQLDMRIDSPLNSGPVVATVSFLVSGILDDPTVNKQPL